MTAAAERLMAQRNTRAFIDADPLLVSFTRQTKEVTAAGGTRASSPSTVDPQRVRLVPLSGNVWDRSKMTTDEGNLPDVTHQLVGMQDLDVKKDDTFIATDAYGRETEWLVVHVSPERTNRTSCYVVTRSQDPVP